MSDRARYYLPEPNVKASVTRLLGNLRGVQIPYPLLSQYMPCQYSKVRGGEIACDAQALLRDRVGQCIDEYLYAVLPF